MKTFSYYRIASFGAALALGILLNCAVAPAAVDMVIGARAVVPAGTATECGAKAKDALNSALQNAFEAGAGTGQWMAYGKPDSSGNSSAAAAIHCFPVGKGYVATFTCSTQVPPDPEMSSTLCAKLTAAFNRGTP